MPPKKARPDENVEELLTKILALNLWIAGANQMAIARAVGKGGKWVNDFLKGIPKSSRPSRSAQ
jgi:hypothetical protein